MSGGFGSNNVEARQRCMVLDTLKKGGAGTPTISGSAAAFYNIVDNGVGDYNINPKAKAVFAQIPEVLIQVKTDNRVAKLGTVTALGIQVLTEDLSGAAAEADFDIFISGCLARDLIS